MAAARERSDTFVEAISIACDANHRRPQPGQQARRFATDPATGSGDEDAPPTEARRFSHARTIPAIPGADPRLSLSPLGALEPKGPNSPFLHYRNFATGWSRQVYR